MKNRIFSAVALAALLLMAACQKAETEEPLSEPRPVTENKDGFSFTATTLDYVATAAPSDVVAVGGIPKIKKGSDPVRVFTFTNTSSVPLLVKNAKGSCGCLVPTYPKEPLQPGESSTIEVRYDTQRVGPFTKTVTLTTSGQPETMTLVVKGDVAQ